MGPLAADSMYQRVGQGREAVQLRVQLVAMQQEQGSWVCWKGSQAGWDGREAHQQGSQVLLASSSGALEKRVWLTVGQQVLCLTVR